MRLNFLLFAFSCALTNAKIGEDKTYSLKEEVRLSEQSGLRVPAIATVSSGTALAVSCDDAKAASNTIFMVAGVLATVITGGTAGVVLGVLGAIGPLNDLWGCPEFGFKTLEEFEEKVEGLIQDDKAKDIISDFEVIQRHFSTQRLIEPIGESDRCKIYRKVNKYCTKDPVMMSKNCQLSCGGSWTHPCEINQCKIDPLKEILEDLDRILIDGIGKSKEQLVKLIPSVFISALLQYMMVTQVAISLMKEGSVDCTHYKKEYKANFAGIWNNLRENSAGYLVRYEDVAGFEAAQGVSPGGVLDALGIYCYDSCSWSGLKVTSRIYCRGQTPKQQRQLEHSKVNLTFKQSWTGFGKCDGMEGREATQKNRVKELYAKAEHYDWLDLVDEEIQGLKKIKDALDSNSAHLMCGSRL